MSDVDKFCAACKLISKPQLPNGIWPNHYTKSMDALRFDFALIVQITYQSTNK